jgi:predicted nucleic acid-binding protein
LSLVVDCSVALSWHFEDESSAYADQALDTVVTDGAILPFHWKAEIANGLLMGIRRKRITPEDRSQILSEFEQLKLEIDVAGLDQVWTGASQLADVHGLTVYDAIYLELAVRRRLQLATLDGKLEKASKALGIFWTGVS